MGSGINKKERIVWLCHFANNEIKKHFDTPNINEFAPWIDGLIKLFEEQNRYEIHIVAPNVFNNKEAFFITNNIYYHFFKYTPLPGNNGLITKAYGRFRLDELLYYRWNKWRIVRIINRIQPKLIHLHGAENPRYSSGFLSLYKKYKILLTIQGFVRSTTMDLNKHLKRRIKLEETILKKSKYFGIRTKEMSRLITEINPQARFFHHNYPITVPALVKTKDVKETIDCVFFAKICKDKGIEDLLKAIAILKEDIPNITLSIIGMASPYYLAYLKKLCEELHIIGNVTFLGFLSRQEDIYSYVVNSKMCVLPTYHDIIPGTIIESMFIKLPVVAYAVGGIPELNDERETIKLVEKGNINMLASAIRYLINNKIYRRVLADNSFVLAHKRFENENIVGDILNIYTNILFE